MFSQRLSVRLLSFVGVLLAVGLLPACSHYQLGMGGKLTFQTLYIAPVENSADLPQAAALFSSQLRETFARDGRVRLVNSPSEADATLTVDLSRFGRNMTTSRPDDSGLARKFDLSVTALCSLRDNRNGSLLFEKRTVEATRQIFTTPTPTATESDQLQAEYNTMPLLAQSLSQNIAAIVLDVW